MPGLGFRVRSYVLSVRATKLASRTIEATAGILLARDPRVPAPAPPPSPEPTTHTLRLNARNLAVSAVRIDGTNAKFRVSDFLAKIVDDDTHRDLQSLSACFTGDLVAANQGELEIQIPDDAMLAEPTLLVEIDYETMPGRDRNIVFAMLNDPRDAHAYTTTGFAHTSELGAGCGSRCWFPCVDTLADVCTYKIQIEVATAHVAVATGKLLARRTLPNSTVFEFEHDVPIPPSSVGFVVGPFRKVTTNDCPWLTSYVLASRAALLSHQDAKDVQTALRALAEYMGHDPSPHAQIFVAREAAYDAVLPFATLSLVSDEFLCSHTSAASVEGWDHANETSVFWRVLGVAAQFFGVGGVVTPATAGDVWVPVGLAALVALKAVRAGCGEQAHHALLLRWMRRVRHTEALAANTATTHSRAGVVLGRTLSRPRPYSLPVDAALWAARGVSFDSFFACKAGLVMRMIEQRATPVVFRDTVRRLVSVTERTALHPITPSSASVASATPTATPRASHPTRQVSGSSTTTTTTGGATHAPFFDRVAVSEMAFLTAIKARAQALARDVDATFVNQWLRHTGIPEFLGVVSYNARHNRVELTLKQLIKPGGRVYMGAVKVRIVEIDGAWDYEKQIDNVEHRWAFECRSRRAQEQRKRGRRSQAYERILMEKDSWRHPENLGTDKLLSLAGNAVKRSWWDNPSPVKYVVLDPDHAWIMNVAWVQPEAYWLEMLSDVSLLKNASVLSGALDQVVHEANVTQLVPEDPTGNLRSASAVAALFQNAEAAELVRRQACQALLEWHQNHVGSISFDASALELFVKVYKQLYCRRGSGEPLALSSTRVGERALRPIAIETLAKFRNERGHAPSQVRDLVLDAVRMFDAGDVEDDGPYLGALARAAAELAVSLSRAKDDAPEDALQEREEFAQMVDELVKWIRSVLDYAIVSAETNDACLSAAGIGCLQALYRLEVNAVVPVGSTKFQSFVEDPAWARDARARLEGFRCVLWLYVVERKAKSAAWMNVVTWLLRQAANDSCLATRRAMLKLCLNAHSATVGYDITELNGGEKSPAGCFWPLLQMASDMASPEELRAARGVAQALWCLINESAAFDSPLRILAHQLWRMVWGVNPVPFMEDDDLKVPELGSLEHWFDESEKEFLRDEKSMIHVEDVESLKSKQQAIVAERERGRGGRASSGAAAAANGGVHYGMDAGGAGGSVKSIRLAAPVSKPPSRPTSGLGLPPSAGVVPSSTKALLAGALGDVDWEMGSGVGGGAGMGGGADDIVEEVEEVVDDAPRDDAPTAAAPSSSTAATTTTMDASFAAV